MKKILLVEDEPAIAKTIRYNLEKRGFLVVHEANGKNALAKGLSQDFDLLILDVMLPELDGFSICKGLREKNVLTPILMLTARSEVDNRVKGIQLGADDYLGKPFALEELYARVDALLRRQAWTGVAKSHPFRPETSKPLEIGPLKFDPVSLELYGEAAKKIQLTLIEAKLLESLIEARGQPLRRSAILKKVWGLHEETQTRTLDTFIMRLRQHLQAAGGDAHWIESVRSIGYRLTPPERP